MKSKGGEGFYFVILCVALDYIMYREKMIKINKT